jgi:LacI family transcriptional regulator
LSSSSRKVSQTQIARDLGVSQAPVSLVLNGRRDGINPATYNRIWEHTARCGYRAKGMNPAAAVAATRPPQIGIVLRPSLSLSRLGNYFSHVQHGLHAAFDAVGGQAVFLGAEQALDAARLTQLFRSGHFLQGLVVFGDVSRSFLETLLSFEPHVVSVAGGPSIPGHTVDGNEAASLDLIVRHLHDLGHRRIGWLGGKAGQRRHENRFASFRAALAKHGLSANSRYETIHRDADRAEGAEAVHALLPLSRHRDFPTAFVCYNSLMAAGASLALSRAGWPVPARLSVVGADLPRATTKDELAVTGAGASPEAIGRAAARLLLEPRTEPLPHYQQLVLPATLKIGETSGKAPAASHPRRSKIFARA